MIFHLDHASGIPVSLQLMQQIRRGCDLFAGRPLVARLLPIARRIPGAVIRKSEY